MILGLAVQPGQSDDGLQRRAQFVRGVGEKLIFYRFRLLQLLHQFHGALVGAGVVTGQQQPLPDQADHHARGAEIAQVLALKIHHNIAHHGDKQNAIHRGEREGAGPSLPCGTEGGEQDITRHQQGCALHCPEQHGQRAAGQQQASQQEDDSNGAPVLSGAAMKLIGKELRAEFA